jgi:uncharacterized protein (DUF488 family)
MRVIWTVGHSNQPVAGLMALLVEAGIEALVDVRRYPMSRRNPQFNRDRLAATLTELGIDYRHCEALGGRRTPRPDSINTALHNEQFRGYADYMATAEFEAALADVTTLAEQKRVAIMCAEALPWNCHRSLVSDLLTARGFEVVHLMDAGSRPHAMTATARVNGQGVTYPGLL